MRLSVLLLGISILSGCIIAVSEDHIKRAHTVCAPNGGVKEINTVEQKIFCKNGAGFYVNG